MNPSSDTGATEFLANLSVDKIVLAALCLTILRLLILQASGAFQKRNTADTSFARGIAEIFESLVIAGVLVFLVIRPFFVQAFFIPSESMEPTLMGHDAGSMRGDDSHSDTIHDHIFVNKLVYRYDHPHFGDIIVFKAPKKADGEHINPDAKVENVLIKRLIGVPGDTIEVKTDGVYRNGQLLKEPYINGKMDPFRLQDFVFGVQNSRGDEDTPGGPIHLGPHQLWVMGDNRNNSNDSRYWGPLEDWRVIGKANLIFWPPSRIHVLH